MHRTAEEHRTYGDKPAQPSDYKTATTRSRARRKMRGCSRRISRRMDASGISSRESAPAGRSGDTSRSPDRR
jgi:hypothetical protein